MALGQAQKSNAQIPRFQSGRGGGGCNFRCEISHQTPDSLDKCDDGDVCRGILARRERKEHSISSSCGPACLKRTVFNVEDISASLTAVGLGAGDWRWHDPVEAPDILHAQTYMYRCARLDAITSLAVPISEARGSSPNDDGLGYPKVVNDQMREDGANRAIGRHQHTAISHQVSRFNLTDCSWAFRCIRHVRNLDEATQYLKQKVVEGKVFGLPIQFKTVTHSMVPPDDSHLFNAKACSEAH
ncbi:hypothetical protein VFPPC_16626 [Pochonia chlamydosporia 170]|uniref:Uncharacterized protein n=1 Tax=Pochonia chlamydosporia 170 TaxID=1380566 RepID=A0A179F9V0_METCM|nr:hypothetical protein VFPPC_16626 [Pochonia chlamydosporia 170]OAQ62218.1 hypothetical protein VFPPC_16626 [Pochonia chlamydosporia 170]